MIYQLRLCNRHCRFDSSSWSLRTCFLEQPPTKGVTVASDESRLHLAKACRFWRFDLRIQKIRGHSSVRSAKGSRGLRLVVATQATSIKRVGPCLLFGPGRAEPYGKVWLLSTLGVKSIFDGSSKIEGSSLAPKMHKNELGVFPHGMIPNRSDADPFQA